MDSTGSRCATGDAFRALVITDASIRGHRAAWIVASVLFTSWLAELHAVISISAITLSLELASFSLSRDILFLTLEAY